MQVGLIGAGLLGSALAERFVRAGHTVRGFDTDAARLKALTDIGAQAAGSAREAAEWGEIVVLCLPDSSVSMRVCADIAGELGEDKILVDTTTGAPGEMEEIGRRVPRYLDATVAGSSGQVRKGEAVALAGGDTRDFDACRGLLMSFCGRAFHVGPRGAGARMKLVVNLVLGLNRAALAEGLAFAESMGMDLGLTLEVLRSGPAHSVALDRKGEKMIRRDYGPEARLRQHHKDVRLMLKEAAQLGMTLPLSEVHDRLLEAAEGAGYADADNSAVLEALRQKCR